MLEMKKQGCVMASIYADGSPVPDNVCTVPDNTISTFSVQVRSMDPVTEQRIRNLLQRVMEVVDIEETERISVRLNFDKHCNDLLKK